MSSFVVTFLITHLDVSIFTSTFGSKVILEYSFGISNFKLSTIKSPTIIISLIFISSLKFEILIFFKLSKLSFGEVNKPVLGKIPNPLALTFI